MFVSLPDGHDILLEPGFLREVSMIKSFLLGLRLNQRDMLRMKSRPNRSCQN